MVFRGKVFQDRGWGKSGQEEGVGCFLRPHWLLFGYPSRPSGDSRVPLAPVSRGGVGAFLSWGAVRCTEASESKTALTVTLGLPPG